MSYWMNFDKPWVLSPHTSPAICEGQGEDDISSLLAEMNWVITFESRGPPHWDRPNFYTPLLCGFILKVI